jgi:hypothetical protein
LPFFSSLHAAALRSANDLSKKENPYHVSKSLRVGVINPALDGML